MFTCVDHELCREIEVVHSSFMHLLDCKRATKLTVVYPNCRSHHFKLQRNYEELATQTMKRCIRTFVGNGDKEDTGTCHS
ncbi:uncharacterized protein PHALS_15158 [Plasmopara halstedii]|uniref:Uncharacterized protein n=1 Tax=Plasmopara halstedii TaxID=4781 RepID=A0A0P1B3Q3_PLAHL|nr:uncharacterized protein PHALS_15158 [Plasmopara halstedii]CEG48590.1 hypothetical protein PHALS_15158 [Plasmopara halstedii]|eukprot:XP_024584959.1 hypothetical protein PHALS_15158 [Plasmopara halstedii]